MRVRYTDSAADELEEIISYLHKVAPSIVTGFADAIDTAVSQLLDNPYLVQETEMPGIRRWYIRRFRHSILYCRERRARHSSHSARRAPLAVAGC
jgi:plasmid stabilization system protein ParE